MRSVRRLLSDRGDEYTSRTQALAKVSDFADGPWTKNRDFEGAVTVPQVGETNDTIFFPFMDRTE